MPPKKRNQKKKKRALLGESDEQSAPIVKRVRAPDAQENCLQELLFGRQTVDGFGEEEGKSVDVNEGVVDIRALLGLGDKKPDAADEDEGREDDVTTLKDDEGEAAPVWVDEDDAKLQVNISKVNRLRKLRKDESESVISGDEYARRLRMQHGQISFATDWAKPSKHVEADSDSFLQSTDKLLGSGKSVSLEQGTLHMQRMKDANHLAPSQSVVSALEFHRNGHVIFTAGMDKTVRLFQVDGLRNTKLQSVYLADMPIRCAHFTPNGHEIIMSGRRSYFYTYDVVTGTLTKVPSIRGVAQKSLEHFAIAPDNKLLAFSGPNGNLSLVSNQTKQWVGGLKMNGQVSDCVFSPDGMLLYSHGGDGEVYVWDVRQRQCLKRFVDEGCVHGTVLGISKDSQYVTTGSDSGIVNMYHTNDLLTASSGSSSFDFATRLAPKPFKTITNLTTEVNGIEFNHDSQVMAAFSSYKLDAMKMVHVPTQTVFSNWPTANTPLHYVSSMAFSPTSGYFAVGNDRGKVLLYRLNDYVRA